MKREYRRILLDELERYEAMGWMAVTATHDGETLPVVESAGGVLLATVIWREIVPRQLGLLGTGKP